jgi:hypothetical protein
MNDTVEGEVYVIGDMDRTLSVFIKRYGGLEKIYEEIDKNIDDEINGYTFKSINQTAVVNLKETQEILKTYLTQNQKKTISLTPRSKVMSVEVEILLSPDYRSGRRQILENLQVVLIILLIVVHELIVVMSLYLNLMQIERMLLTQQIVLILVLISQQLVSLL